MIDPPFISESVWKLYAVTTKLLLKNGASHVVATTVHENADLMKTLFGCQPALFQPSIPHLVYQYSAFVNFSCEALAKRNNELND